MSTWITRLLALPRLSRCRPPRAPGRRLLAALGAALALSAVSATQAQAERPAVPLYDNLGAHHYAISTSVPQAQRYFDQGLRLYYAFNHQEAIRAFEEAVRLDPDCAMCYWGIALAYGPNINAPMDASAGAAAHAAIQKALERKASPKEQALIRALATRYAAPPPAERSALDAAYARAMREVVREYPEDQEAATLFAESLMDLSPWQYWSQDGQPRPDTPEMLAQLERVIAANPNHPGACHFFIHAVEATQPERAVPCAERLAGLMPGAGHLVHMPGHIYIRVGRYEDAIRANEHAVHADETFIRDQNPAFGVYLAGYYPHNYDFLAFAASMIGRSGQALAATRKMAELVPQPMLREPGMTFLQQHQTRQLQMLVRFGRWDEILKAPAPPQDLPHARALWHYAHGRALAARGDLPGAEADLAPLRATAQDPRMDALRLEFNTSGAILKIATEVLAGQIAARKADFPRAIGHLREAAHLEDRLVYGEPPEWTVPVREELGLVLLAAERSEEAEQAFREDLKRFPENGWSLHGLALALQAQDRTAEADAVLERFRKVWAGADMQLAEAAR
ncbi:tetratricopeptide repeat protein [Azotobacter chroococcum]|uniref:tetratricopeptide repeat protein n=1 Tax=Azotobacter chroococcum TaxID=353 RepID=UPI001F602867|nr:tetratricopeptide repeat protein [Azotobacter chroococcum]